MSIKYVGIDLHASSTSQLAVRDEKGEMFWDVMSVKTQPEPMLTAIKAIQGDVQVAFEAGTGSQWLRELLEPHADRVVVCHAADNVRSRGNKTDKADAAELSRLLWLGELTEVYQLSEPQSALKELVQRYHRNVDKVVRAKNQLKALYRRRNIECGGSEIYDPEQRQAWLDKIERDVLRESARELLEEIEFLGQARRKAKRLMLREARRRSGWTSVVSLPGFGEIRTARALGIIGTPYRFPTKRQLWRYSCLGVVVHDSREWVSHGPDGVTRHREQKTRGLNTDGRSDLKAIFKGAAKTAIQQYPEVVEDFEARCQIKNPDKATLDIARKLASQCLTIWKRQEVYDPEKARWKTMSSDN